VGAVAVLRFTVWGEWGGHIFRWESQNYTIMATNTGFGERGVHQKVCGTKSPETESFSLNYTLILDFLSIYNINLRFYVDTMNKCN